MPRIRLLLVFLFAAVAWNRPTEATAQASTELYVTPDSLRLAPGEHRTLAVQAFDGVGNVILSLGFRSSDERVVRVSGNGVVTAMHPGRAEITVSAGRRTRAVPVQVGGGTFADRSSASRSPAATLAAEIAGLVAEPATLTLLPTERARVAIRAVRGDGSPLMSLPARVDWRSLTPDVVTVAESGGVVTALSSGQGTIEAYTTRGVSVRVPVTVGLTEFSLSADSLVLGPGEADTVGAVVPAQGNRPLRVADLQWSSTDPSVVQVDGAGRLFAVDPGHAEVVVRGFLQERKIAVVVHPEVTRFLTRPRLGDAVQLPVLATRQFRLELQAADSTPVTGLPVTWSVDDSTVARFEPATGELLGLRPGRTTLSFVVRGFVPKSWSVEVIPGTVGLDRTRVGLRVGEVTRLTPALLDEQGRPLAPAEGVMWQSSDPRVVSAAPTGELRGLAPGRAEVRAALPAGQQASATVFVTGDLLITSTRSGRFGVFGLTAARPDSFYAVVVDSAANAVGGAWSPDRTQVVFASDRAERGNYDIFVADADGRNWVRLTSDPAPESQPVWTHDGQRIVFVSSRRGRKQLYIMNADGRGQRALTSLAGGAEDPAVSPDGRTIAFTGFADAPDGQSDIYLVAVDGGEARPVTRTGDRRESRPGWLASGELIWMVSGRGRKSPDVVLRQPGDGGPPVPLVTSDFPLADVALARDGSRIAWIASRPSERNQDQLEFTFQWRSLTNGVQTSVRLRPGERVTSPAF